MLTCCCEACRLDSSGVASSLSSARMASPWQACIALTTRAAEKPIARSDASLQRVPWPARSPDDCAACRVTGPAPSPDPWRRPSICVALSRACGVLRLPEDGGIARLVAGPALSPDPCRELSASVSTSVTLSRTSGVMLLPGSDPTTSEPTASPTAPPPACGSGNSGVTLPNSSEERRAMHEAASRRGASSRGASGVGSGVGASGRGASGIGESRSSFHVAATLASSSTSATPR
jgi:hypothetical protein